ncbi:MAG: hypothetical protein ACR2J3_05370 [Aridibacter sp.]
MSNSLLEKIFRILAVIFFAIAAFFLWQENFDGVFISAVLACVSFLLSHRFQLKERLDKRKGERLEKEFADENYKGSLFEGNEAADLELENDREEILIER